MVHVHSWIFVHYCFLQAMWHVSVTAMILASTSRNRSYYGVWEFIHFIFLSELVMEQWCMWHEIYCASTDIAEEWLAHYEIISLQGVDAIHKPFPQDSNKQHKELSARIALRYNISANPLGDRWVLIKKKRGTQISMNGFMPLYSCIILLSHVQSYGSNKSVGCNFSGFSRMPAIVAVYDEKWQVK